MAVTATTTTMRTIQPAPTARARVPSVSAARTTRSERDVAVLALRARLMLRLQRLERRDELRPCLVRDDDVVDVAALGRRVRVREARLVVVDQALAALVRRRRLLELAAVDDVDGALRAHHRDLRRRPREVEVGEHVLRGHDV